MIAARRETAAYFLFPLLYCRRSRREPNFSNAATTVVSRIFRTFSLAERHPALAHAVMAPLICWSLSSSMLRYLFVDHAVPAMWRSLAAARLSVRKRAHDTGAPPDLAQDALDRVVGANPPPMLFASFFRPWPGHEKSAPIGYSRSCSRSPTTRAVHQSGRGSAAAQSPGYAEMGAF